MEKTEEEKLAEPFLKSNGFSFEEGFAINMAEMNPDDYEEIYMVGKTLDEAISDFVRPAGWWILDISDGEVVFEDIWAAVEYAEGYSDRTFADFTKANGVKED